MTAQLNQAVWGDWFQDMTAALSIQLSGTVPGKCSLHMMLSSRNLAATFCPLPNYVFDFTATCFLKRLFKIPLGILNVTELKDEAVLQRRNLQEHQDFALAARSGSGCVFAGS